MDSCIDVLLNNATNAICSISRQCLNNVDDPSVKCNEYLPQPITMLSALPGKYNTAADLLLSVNHPVVDDDITNMYGAHFYIPYNIPPSINVFIRGIRPSESI